MFPCFSIILAGMSTVAVMVDDETGVRSVGRNIGLSSVDSKGPNHKEWTVVLHIGEQQQFYAYVVHVQREDLVVGVGDERRASSGSGSFRRCTSTRISIRNGARKDPVVRIATRSTKKSDAGIKVSTYHEGNGTRLELERSNGVFMLMIQLLHAARWKT